jgi:hypothetical protein
MDINMTQALRIKTTVTQDGELHLEGPFRAGDSVEVIVLSQAESDKVENPYPLRGMPIKYLDPYASVVEEDWDAVQ